jgi:hypothetical protein
LFSYVGQSTLILSFLFSILFCAYNIMLVINIFALVKSEMQMRQNKVEDADVNEYTCKTVSL